MSRPFKAVVLAAGMGTRLNSPVPKVLHKVLGRDMVTYPIDAALAAGAVEVAVVVGHGRDQVERALDRRYQTNIDDGPGDAYVTTHVQHEMLGTADAVKAAAPAFAEFDGAVMILSGDVPNIPSECIAQLLEIHERGLSPVSMVTAHDQTKNAYGRIERDAIGGVTAITEYKDAGEAVRALTEVNLGTYLVTPISFVTDSPRSTATTLRESSTSPTWSPWRTPAVVRLKPSSGRTSTRFTA